MTTEPHRRETCAHCGAPAAEPVSGLVRAAVLVYCSPACRDDHLAAVALASDTCAAPGCDLDPAADVPFCDEHLDPAASGVGHDHGARWRAA
jgi:hypothetical protein